MTYQDTVDLIRDICKDVNPNGSFIHGTRSDGSLTYHTPFPQIHLYPFQSILDMVNGFDSSAILMGFWFQDNASSSPQEREKIVSDADAMCRAFITAINERSVTISAVKVEPQYQTLSSVLSGYALSFTIISKTKSC